MGSSAFVEQENEAVTQTRVEMLQQEVFRKQAELDSLRVLSTENKYLRENIMVLHDQVQLLVPNWTEPVTGEGISLRAQLLAYQRYNRVLQDELDCKEETIVELRGKVEQQEDELVASRQRCSILFERLCAAGAVSPVNNNEEAVDGGMIWSIVADEDDPTRFFSLARKLQGVEKERELLQEGLISLQEDYERRGVLVASVRRENTALRASVSQLIHQVQLSATSQLENTMENGASVPPKTIVEGRDGVAVDPHLKFLECHAQKELKTT
ncbi:hypothetical protein TraAM80_07305 [Trypanosoma rangeli]|uniref:Uncharacterized protein n=1 Tax=Trypanosoma rangeli TaxID=5698 RepID=A0A3R7N6C0_TRYRA|nr:uncharacterized protein TraAM80_07305 [Trypanosoma rangeli]RNF00968.1 hypothetical protein TraAM80_07305 [Trypanosoma rangeli]|eukprot:RNF00968.1 hypothetical protein TraAM80_07305 [Trypanosoma rangeli]